MKRMIWICLLLTAYCSTFTDARAQSYTIRRVITVPASCDYRGINASPVLYKVPTSALDTTGGLYVCNPATSTYAHQTNVFGAGLTAKTMIYANAAPAIVSTTAPTNGQVLIGDTGNVPALGTLTGTANETLITNGAHSITIGLASVINHKAGNAFILTDITDTTKRFQFQPGGITAGNTRNVYIPDSDTKIPISSQFLTFTGPTMPRTITIPDSDFTIPTNAAGVNVVPKSDGTNFVASRITDDVSGMEIDLGATDIFKVAVGPDPTLNPQLVIDGAGGFNLESILPVTIGDYGGNANHTYAEVKDSTKEIELTASTESLAIDGVAHTVNIAAAGAVTVNSLPLEQVLSSTDSVNLNTATPTSLYTCPTGKTCAVTKVMVTAASTSLTTASYSFGWNSASFNDVIADATHTELTGSTLYTFLNAKTGAKLGAAADVFSVKANTLQGAAATVTIRVFGIIY